MTATESQEGGSRGASPPAGERPARPPLAPPARPTPGGRKRRPRRRFAPRDLLRARLQLPLLLAATALGLLFAWQARYPFALAIGGPDDAPFLRGFHEVETARDTGEHFRWTRGSSAIVIPGYGAADATLTLRLQGAHPSGPPPVVAIAIGNGPPTTLEVGPEQRDYSFAVPAAAFDDGGLRVALDTPTFRPAGDARDLGIAVSRVELRDTGGAGGLVVPPWRALGVALLGVLAAYGATALALRSAAVAALAGWATAGAFASFALAPRFTLALYAPTLLAIIAAGAILALLTAQVLWWLRRQRAWECTERALGGAALIAATNFLALLIGMQHPQYRSSDLMLNVHRLEFVQRGDWVFTLALPGARALEAPYPPLFYAVMLPFSYLVPDKRVLVEVVAALAIALGALLTFALARRVTGEDAPALWAAGIYAILPVTYNMASAGNFANLFGQGVATLYLVALVFAFGHWHRPLAAVGLTLGLTLALLGHFGVFLSLLVTLPLLIVVLALRGREGRVQALALAASFAVALLLSWALYYRFHGALLLGHLGDFLGGETNARGGSAAEATTAERVRNEWWGILLYWGWPALPLGLAGINLLLRVRPGRPLTLTLTWLATALPFLLAALVAGLSVRFHLFVAPALAVVAGWALWQVWRTHRALGPLAGLAIGAFWLWQGLAYWIDRILHAYR